MIFHNTSSLDVWILAPRYGIVSQLIPDIAGRRLAVDAHAKACVVAAGRRSAIGPTELVVIVQLTFCCLILTSTGSVPVPVPLVIILASLVSVSESNA